MWRTALCSETKANRGDLFVQFCVSRRRLIWRVQLLVSVAAMVLCKKATAAKKRTVAHTKEGAALLFGIPTCGLS